MRSPLGTRLQHCCRRPQDFCLSFEKGRITSFGEQDEIGLNRFPCLASYGSFSVSSAASVGSEHISNETFHSYLCGAGPAPDIPSLQLLAVLSNSRSPRHCTESPIPKEEVWRLHEGWDLFKSPNLNLTVTASKLPSAASVPPSPTDMLWRGVLQCLHFQECCLLSFQVWERTLRHPGQPHRVGTHG